ncbi:M20/M25/M40 family metallo-hydrolase [Brenneria goodwinii]|uniref:M20/M25/M40 family metallo-hydrolase n=1 Tax=Brenneria goodwinii TaxID=1109412 RepID=UPI0015FFBDB5|nr:M20/M25/M40 family metallo-hydrolase [Brenneria goodwinii]MCG8158079.1 M20/M25/M40 family metallo-hydrolase [Brenneria goodwinii]MCG8162420.1 M20/M25/M40 family metallo-hydrolase [Brenneria goodwinii]MCG8167130.1 M20/M25/M40 family metallo-hydrolase [Brenneria goodwinii]MCG8171790.1 M20/M25/M40 family metallo-hydrolase [Brenneria goodwinii]MCG8176578.1 M20/M25/M40 family metallo-hydrolase [Brenneria goodwinii]
MTMTSAAMLQATLALLEQITPFRSVSGQIEQQRALAQWLETWLVQEIGARPVSPVAQQQRQSAPPLVHVRLDRGAHKTLVLYNMYDVMPADEDGWEVPPFTGGVRRWPELGDVYISRGAENNKGPLAGMLTVVKTLRDSGNLTVNLEIILEGEEEIGSGRLRRYLAQTPCPIAPADAVLFPSLCEYGGGQPRVYLGFTGLSNGRLTVKGGDWGGPQAAIHASNASWIANPAWRLVQALHAIAPPENNGVLAAIKPDDEANKLLAELADNFSIDDELRFRRSRRLTLTGDTLSCLQTFIGSAVLNLSELKTAPTGARGVIPPFAEAELAFRTPPGIDGAQLIDAAYARLAAPALAGAELTLDDSYPGYRFTLDAPGVRQLLASYRRLGAQPQIWPWAPGCAPAYAFAPIAPAFLIGGLGHGGNAHGVNEFVTLRGLQRFIESLTDWLTRFTESAESQPLT